ncbi:MAG TPA: DUF3450 family protein [Opitutaceae bacterium]|nr:DUF3450 family protein [Opitutaceae bacterium]
MPLPLFGHGIVCLLAGALCALAQPSFAADARDSADKAATEWINLQVESARLKTDWQRQREVLESLASATEERAKSLEEKRDLTKARTAHEREQIEALQAKNRSAAADLKATEARLRVLVSKLAVIRPMLPPRLSDALEMSYRSLAESNLPTSERMQVAMTVLNRCAEFDHLVTVGQDKLNLDGEPPNKYFEVIYWGLSRGYAIDREARKAWLGMPAGERWAWQAQPGAYDHIVQLMAIAQDKNEPDFISVPAAVRRSVNAASGGAR